jgi:zinc protease
MMRTLVVIFIWWATAFAATAGNIPLVEFKTPHGIRVTYFHSDTQDTVAIAVAFDCGTACDGVNGTATGPLAVSMLYEGADGKSSSELYESLQDVGANFSIDATPDQTYGSISAPTRGIDGAVGLINSILRHPDMPENRFKRRRDTMARRAEESSFYPESAIQKAFFETGIGPHPYLNYFAPKPENIRAVQLSDLKPWLKSHLNLKDVIVSLVGNVDQAHASALVDRLFDGLPETSDLKPVPVVQFETPLSGPIILKGDKSGQASIVVGSIFPRDVALNDWVAGYMLSSIFSGDQKSRLFKDIREGTAVTYGLQPSINFYEALAVNSVRGRISTVNANETLMRIGKSWDKFRNEGPTASEVDNARAEQLNTLNVLSRNHESFAGMLRDYRTGHWSTAEIAGLPDVIRNVNLNDPAVLKRYFSEKPIVVVAQ